MNSTFDPFNINKNNISSPTKGVVPFTVCYVPENSKELTEKFGRFDNCYYDWFYLRTGNSLDEVISRTSEEFEKLGLPQGRFNPTFISGEYQIDGSQVNVQVELKDSEDFRFWVAEGLIGEFYTSSDLDLPKISTNRTPSLKLYEKASIFGRDDAFGTEESKFDLIELLKDEKTACSIEIPGKYLTKRAVFDASRGRAPSDVRVMNYGYIWERKETYFQDPETGEAFILPNHDLPDENHIKKFYAKKDAKLPVKGVVGFDPLERLTFREMDKVHLNRDNLYFDGTLRDMFVIMKERGIGFIPEIEEKYQL